MQSSLMFIDMPSQGFLTNIDKIAIKMPKGQGDAENAAFGGFADIINALMATVPAEDLQRSLNQLEWVPVDEGGVPGFAPLIDLTREQTKAIGMANRLLSETGPETLRQSESLKSILFSSLESTSVGGEKIESQTGPEVLKRLMGIEDGNPGRTGDQHGQLRGGVAQKLADGAMAVDQKLADGAMAVDQKINPEAEDIKLKATPLKGESDLINSKMTEGGKGKDVPPVALRTEGADREIKLVTTERRSSRMAPVQQPGGNRQAGPEGESGQQFTGNMEQESTPLVKQEANARVRDDAPFQDFKRGIVENSLDTSKESSEPIPKAGSDMRESQAPVSKMKPTFGERMEGASGGREMAPSTSQEMQNNVIRQIVQRMTLQTHGNQSTMTIKLKPEFLGQVQMQISTDQQQVVVRMATESMAVKEMVEQGLQYLKSELQQHGLEIDKFDVFVANDNEDNNKHSQDWAGFRQALKRRQQNDMKQDKNGTDEKESSISDDVENRRSPNSTGEVDYFA